MITASSKSPRAGSPVREKAMAPQFFGSATMIGYHDRCHARRLAAVAAFLRLAGNDRPVFRKPEGYGDEISDHCHGYPLQLAFAALPGALPCPCLKLAFGGARPLPVKIVPPARDDVCGPFDRDKDQVQRLVHPRQKA